IIFCIASSWRFPIPFLWGIDTPIFTTNLSIAHLVVLRKRLVGPAGLIAATIVYFPAAITQFSQVLIYPAFSAIFERSSSSQQIVMAILFPFVKYAMRTLLRKYTKRLGDRGEKVAVSGPGFLTAPTSAPVLTRASPSGPSVANIPDRESKPLDDWKPQEQHQVIRHALELVSTAETILLIEYFEVTIPVLNAVFSRSRAVSHQQVRPEARRVMKARYGLSALYHLVFTLEYHARSIQGKMLGWLLVILHLDSSHLGTDLSFQCDFQRRTNSTASAS
ncbi:hypothetical protein Gpo141_00014615, partial [Globisporangium polare]